MADAAPEFQLGLSFISDVQMDHAVSNDGQTITVTFANFEATILPNGPRVVTRAFSFVLPLKNVGAGARLTGGVQGGGVMDPGTGGFLIVRAGGTSLAFDGLFGPGDRDGFLKEVNLPVPPGGDLRLTIILGLEASATDRMAQVQMNVNSVDLTISPGEPELNV